MSGTLRLKAEIDALCKAAGLESSDVTRIELYADTRSIQFTVISRAVWYDPDTGRPDEYILTFPFIYGE